MMERRVWLYAPANAHWHVAEADWLLLLQWRAGISNGQVLPVDKSLALTKEML